MAGQMKGLTQFMADIRNAKAQDEEDKRIQAELVNIQKQFADRQHLTGYQRKKYICKLLYIYLLGNNKFDFGFMESIELISSNVYSEKQIGYLAVEFFVSRNRELLLAVVNSLKTDLASDNSDFISLALQCIATLGEETLAEALTEDVFQILRSPTLEPILKKKASLALLKLLQLSPHFILEKHPNWIPRIIACIDDQDLGFAQSVTSTIRFIARLSPESCKLCIPSVTGRLSQLIIKEDCPKDYFYHGVPAPWFTIKLLNLIEILIPDTYSSDIDNITLSTLRKIVATAISRSVDRQNLNKTQQFKNAQSSILFSAVSLGAHLDPSSQASSDAINALGSLIHAHETNTRYLALDALVKVTSRGGTSAIQATYGFLNQILQSFKDRDISIRRKLLDLLYTICDSTSVENICSELLIHLDQSEFSMKTEIAIKVAVLAEKFASDATWYIVTSLKLISLAGNHIADEVWERTIQIIVNNEKLQPLAVKTVVRQLKSNNFPESIVKIAAFLIGEFGHMVQSTISLNEQFELLIDKYYYCSSLTKAMILSSFFKMYIRDDDIRASILDVLESETYSVESEVQQRAAEFLRLVTRDDNLALAKDVCQQLPPFLSNDSPLISRLGNVKDAKEFTKISSLGRKGTVKLPAPPLHRKVHTMTNTSMPGRSITPQLTSESNSKSSSSTFIAHSSNDLMTASANSNDIMSSRNVSSQDTTGTFEPDDGKLIPQHLSLNWEEGYYRLLHFDQGIFYDSSLLKIIYRCRRGRNNLSFQLTYVNNSPLPITAFSLSLATITGPEAPYVITTSELPATNIPLNGRTSHTFECIIRSVFDRSLVPVLNISFLSGTLTQLHLKLPIVLMKSVSPAPINNAQEFFRRWQQISLLGSEGEAQKIFTVGHRHSNESIVRVIGRIGFSIVENVDSNSTNIVGAGILHTLQVNAGCLLRLEPNDEGKQFRLTMRCTSPGISKILAETIIELFEYGF